MSYLPPEEAKRRIEGLQARLRSSTPPLDAAILVQNVDVYYFSGTLQTGHLLVPASGAPRLLVRKVLERAEEESPLDDVRPLTSLRDLPVQLRSVMCGPGPWRVGFEMDVVPARLLETYRSILGAGVETLDVAAAVLDLRSVKSEWEIERIRQGSRAIARALGDVPLFLEDDLSTWELQSLLECRARMHGHPGVVRMRGLNVECAAVVAVSGPAGAAPSHGFFPIGGLGIDPAAPSGGDFGKIKRDTPIALDCLGMSGGYYSDQTRMAVKGRFPDEAGAIYSAMQEVLRHCERTLRAGSLPSKVYEEALGIVEARGLSEGFEGPPGLSVGFVGHGIGLEVNETPVLAARFDRPLAAGTVLAIEPKFTHARWGVIGIESTYAVREDRLENLTPLSETVIVA